jgi:phage tail sheath protein FI
MASGPNPNRSTPGVYVTEADAFGSAIVGVATAVPLFVGYTEFAGDPATGASLYNTPVAIASMADYEAFFGGADRPPFVVAPSATDPAGFTLTPRPGAGPDGFNLYWQMLLFFANGGGDCYIVSVGSYRDGSYPRTAAEVADGPRGFIRVTDFIGSGDGAIPGGLVAAAYAKGPTMLVVPEACQLGLADYGKVACAMLTQAGSLQDRLAILDLPGCLSTDSFEALTATQADFWSAIAPALASASYGAAYAPAVHATVVTADDAIFTQFAAPGGNDAINGLLTASAAMLYERPTLATIQAAIATAFPPSAAITGNGAEYSADGSAYPPLTAHQTFAQWQRSLDNLLVNALPLYKLIQQAMALRMNIQPPSGIVAGLWTKSDAQNGVWNAPANIALASMESPLWIFTDDQQGGFNAPINGLAINVLRALPGRGTVVWGARTLDGNSQDYRYINLRRTLILIEQSIKTALQAYVFAANDAITWRAAQAAISNFLTGLWQQGGLAGAKPDDAFSVSVGLGSTMTAQNVLDGYMIVAVQVAIAHPAEYIELTFTQTMGS